MKVQVIGFSLTGDASYPLHGIIPELKKRIGRPRAKATRKFQFVDAIGDPYYCGLISYVNPEKRDLAIVGDIIQEVDLHDDLIRLNYFVINKNSWKGIYLYYHGTSSCSYFANRLNGLYQIVKRSQIKTALRKCGKYSKDALNKALSLTSPLRLNIIAQENDFVAAAEKFASISSAELDLITELRSQDPYAGISSISKKRKLIYSFEESLSRRVLLEAIRTLLDDDCINRIRLKGKLVDDLECSLDSDRPKLPFLELLEFSAIRAKMTGDIKDFASHQIIKYLKDLAQANLYNFK